MKREPLPPVTLRDLCQLVHNVDGVRDVRLIVDTETRTLHFLVDGPAIDLEVIAWSLRWRLAVGFSFTLKHEPRLGFRGGRALDNAWRRRHEALPYSDGDIKWAIGYMASQFKRPLDPDSPDGLGVIGILARASYVPGVGIPADAMSRIRHLASFRKS